MKDSNDPVNIFSATDHLTQEQLVRYHRGEMTKSERYQVEKHLVDCELCKDALSGMALMPNYKGIERIRKDLRKIAMPKRGAMYRVAWLNVIITILVLLLIVVSVLFYIYFTTNHKNKKTGYNSKTQKENSVYLPMSPFNAFPVKARNAEG